MSVPSPVARLLDEEPVAGRTAQAFPFITVDDAGHPHVALLSSVELGTGPDGTLHAVVAGPSTRANLLRDGRATLLAIEGTTAHTLKLALVRHVEAEGALAAVLEVVHHKADSLGIALTPLGFEADARLADLERHDRTARLMALLAGPPR